MGQMSHTPVTMRSLSDAYVSVSQAIDLNITYKKKLDLGVGSP